MRGNGHNNSKKLRSDSQNALMIYFSYSVIDNRNHVEKTRKKNSEGTKVESSNSGMLLVLRSFGLKIDGAKIIKILDRNWNRNKKLSKNGDYKNKLRL